jgi:hypothetical protein
VREEEAPAEALEEEEFTSPVMEEPAEDVEELLVGPEQM